MHLLQVMALVISLLEATHPVTGMHLPIGVSFAGLYRTSSCRCRGKIRSSRVTLESRATREGPFASRHRDPVRDSRPKKYGNLNLRRAAQRADDEKHHEGDFDGDG